MNTKIQKWRNGLGVRIPKTITLIEKASDQSITMVQKKLTVIIHEH